MILCSDCGNRNMEGTFFCEECGNPLLVEVSEAQLQAATRTMTQKLQDTGRITSPTTPQRTNSLGTTSLVSGSAVILSFKNTGAKVQVDVQSELVFGRVDEHRNSYPDYDLTDQQALEQGVSRRHAALRRGESTLTIVDLQSANGTYLNGQKLLPNQPHIVRDGDEISLGRLAFNVFFVI